MPRGIARRCTYSGCWNLSDSSQFIDIEEGKTTGGQDWSSLVGSVLCAACYQRYRQRGTLERAPDHGEKSAVERVVNTPLVGSKRRCTYVHCDKPTNSSKFYQIGEGRTSGGQDWSALVGSVLCKKCYKRFRRRGTLERAPDHGDKSAGSMKRCTYVHCDNPTNSSCFYQIGEGKTAGGQDWSTLVGKVLCEACYRRYLRRGRLEKAMTMGKPLVGSARRCTYDHCDNPTKSCKYYQIGEGSTAGGQDWSALVGSVLCEACYSRYYDRGTLETSWISPFLCDDGATGQPKVRVAGIRAIDVTPTKGGRLIQLPAALATHFNEAIEWPIQKMDDRDVEMLESIEGYDRGNYLVRWMTSEWPTGLPTRKMKKWLTWNKATVVVPYGIDEVWDKYKGGPWTMECCLARRQGAAHAVLADVVKVGSDAEGEVVMGETSEIFIDTDLGSIKWCGENHEQPERVRADRWVKEEAMWEKATSSDQRTRIQDLLRTFWERKPIQPGETREVQRERSRYTVACGKMRLTSTFDQVTVAKRQKISALTKVDAAISKKTLPSRHSQAKQPPTSAQDLGDTGASYGSNIKIKTEPSPSFDQEAAAIGQKTSPSRHSQPKQVPIAAISTEIPSGNAKASPIITPLNKPISGRPYKRSTAPCRARD